MYASTRAHACRAGAVSFLAIVLCASGGGVAQQPGGEGHPWRITDAVVSTVNRGVAFMEQYDYEEAVKAFEEALRSAPESNEVRLNLAVALFNRSGKEDLDRAVKLLDEIIRRQPENLPAAYQRGIIHQYSGQDNEAVACFERVAKAAPRDACVWYLLARSKASLGQPCQPELERAIQENPGLVSAYYLLAQVAMQEDHPEQAAGFRKKFMELRENPLAEMVVTPQYRRMGSLAQVRPLSPADVRSVTSGELSVASPRTVLPSPAAPAFKGLSDEERNTVVGRILSRHGFCVALADVNADGHLDLVAPASTPDGGRSLALLLGGPDHRLTDATAASGLSTVRGALSWAFGDHDNDNKVDLFVCCAGPNHLFRGRGDGTFEDVTAPTRTAGPDAVSVSAVLLDADHDGDLDIYVCNAGTLDGGSPAPNQLLNNNADGTFTDIAVEAGVACPQQRSVMLAPADLDGDRDTDLVVFHEGAPASVFFNDRLGKYHPQKITEEAIQGDGGVLQDFNGDGRADLLVFPGPGVPGRLYLSTGSAMLEPSGQFDGVAKALASWGPMHATRVGDLDLDGDLDVAVFGPAGHVLLNDGWGRFVLKTELWPAPSREGVVATELVDLTGDGTPDLLTVSSAGGGGIALAPTILTPPANWLAVTPTGDRGADKRTRSPASGFGTRVEAQCGLHRQTMVYTGLTGGPGQSHSPLIFGLDRAARADFVLILWPDGVTQSEIGLVAGSCHRISETERRISSCPVLFAWNGRRFEFVTDFAGVGGLGYFVTPGQYAPPQVREHVKIEAGQLVARDGRYELRLCEPMEEVGYVDRLELLAVDHPREAQVYPDERLALTGPPPTHELLCPEQPIFPVHAEGPGGEDGTDRLARVDRLYAYQPKLDRRFFGFAEPHALTLDFGDRLGGLGAGRRVFLFINGWIEYPYSQTTYAARQAGVHWEPLRIDRQAPDGRWDTIIPDAGAPGGMGRMFTVELTGKLSAGDGRFRISTNLEVYYDQLFIAADRATRDLTVRSVPLREAHLRRLGFPLEYSPDGRHPLIYTYDIVQPTLSFRVPRGLYTRYGRVDELLADFDDRYVILGSGDELAVSFDAGRLPPPAPGHVRSFVLVSHAYCKDMDLYTGEPDTVAPLPFARMTAYPYSPSEHYPDGEAFRRYHAKFNTRRVD